jgi:hypothetical protein
MPPVPQRVRTHPDGHRQAAALAGSKGKAEDKGGRRSDVPSGGAGPRNQPSSAGRERGAVVLNPLRSEDEAFRFLMYAIAVIAIVVGLVLVLRAVF